MLSYDIWPLLGHQWIGKPTEAANLEDMSECHALKQLTTSIDKLSCNNHDNKMARKCFLYDQAKRQHNSNQFYRNILQDKALHFTDSCTREGIMEELYTSFIFYVVKDSTISPSWICYMIYILMGRFKKDVAPLLELHLSCTNPLIWYTSDRFRTAYGIIILWSNCHVCRFHESCRQQSHKCHHRASDEVLPPAATLNEEFNTVWMG